MELLLGLTLLLSLFMGYALYKAGNDKTALKVQKTQLESNLRALQDQIDMLQEGLDDERIKNSEILSQKKSSETRLGMISEHLVPMLANFPYKPEDAHFLGQPVDYIIYDLDQAKIVFLEVKSGNSKLSRRQKIIKNIIQQGRVFYEEIRINEKGIKVKNSDTQLS